MIVQVKYEQTKTKKIKERQTKKKIKRKFRKIMNKIKVNKKNRKVIWYKRKNSKWGLNKRKK